MLILDTDAVSHLRKKRRDPRFMAWLNSVDATEIHITSFTVAELYYGFTLAQDKALPIAAELAVWVPTVVASASVLPVDAEIGKLLGSRWSKPALRNLFMTPPSARKIKTGTDLVIAATAVLHDATVVTGNFADFTLIAQHCAGLRVLNPFTGQALPATSA